MTIGAINERPEARLPIGVERRPLTRFADERGWVSELYRRNWPETPELVQWTLSASHANVMRGVHAHIRRTDYLIMLQGTMRLGLIDLRRASATYRVPATIDLAADTAEVILIPPGVGHGFYFPDGGIYSLGLSVYWGEDDEFGCRWDDPALGIQWDAAAPLLSERDSDAGSLAALETRIQPLLGGIAKGPQS